VEIVRHLFVEVLFFVVVELLERNVGSDRCDALNNVNQTKRQKSVKTKKWNC